jgi:dihydrofolate reductase
MPKFSIIVAVDEAGGIGEKGELAWRIPGELKHFRAVTTGQGSNAVIMGKTTWFSIPEKFRPLPGRLNLVLSRRDKNFPGAQAAQSFNQGLQLAADCQEIFVIGGATVYIEALEHPACEKLLITRVQGIHNCDTFLPALPAAFHLANRSEEIMEGEHT